MRLTHRETMLEASPMHGLLRLTHLFIQDIEHPKEHRSLDLVLVGSTNRHEEHFLNQIIGGNGIGAPLQSNKQHFLSNAFQDNLQGACITGLREALELTIEEWPHGSGGLVRTSGVRGRCCGATARGDGAEPATSAHAPSEAPRP
jgi:hypothetical protein